MLVQPWRIEMLGGLRISRGEQTISRFRTQKDAVLLAYLAFYPDKLHVRDELLEVLWPDSDLHAARNRMRVGLNALRHQLEPPGAPPGSVLESGRLTLRLRPEAFGSDVEEFKAAIKAAQRTEDEADQTRSLVTAIETYAGDLLPGFFEEWVLSEREPLAQSYLQALNRLTRIMTQAKDYEAALNYARRAAQSDPLHEQAHRDIMRLCVAVGQPSAALQQFEVLKRLLEDGLGAPPSVTTQQLAQEIADRVGITTAVPVRSPLKIDTKQIDTKQIDTQSGPQAPEPPRDMAPHTASLPPHSRPDPLQSYLPVYLTRFFGREEELTFLTGLLAANPASDSDPIQNPISATQNRLVILTGPGGTGKTRLAMTIAERQRERFAGQVWFVPLADLTDPRLIAGAIASAMRLPHEPHLTGLQQVIEALAQRPALLLLDNFEHLVEDGAMLVEELLSHLPLLTCLVTSRRSLSVPGAREVPLAALPVPHIEAEEFGSRSVPVASAGKSALDVHTLPIDVEGAVGSSSRILDPASLLSFAGICLFVDRAQAVRPGFQLTERNAADIAQLCGELEGIPLAIELAAAQVRVLTPTQMRTRLSRRFDLLVNRRADKHVRHRSMHAVIQSSFHLLSPPLRCLFAQLSVFRGGWTLEAAEAVCITGPDTESLPSPPAAESVHFSGSDSSSLFPPYSLLPTPYSLLPDLERLCMDSLIVADEDDGEMRFRMLETVREFASEQLPPDERIAHARRHAAYCVQFAEEASRHLSKPDEAIWLGYLEKELDNLRAAFDTCRLDPERGEEGLRLAHALHRFWTTRGPVREGRQRVATALEHPGAQDDTAYRADALHTAGGLALAQDDYECARALTEQSLQTAQKAGYRQGIANALSNLANIAYHQGSLDRAEELQRQSLALKRELDDKEGISVSLHNLAMIAQQRYDYASARALYIESQELYRQLGNRLGMAFTHGNLGNIAGRLNEIEEARAHYEQSMALLRELGHKVGLAGALVQMATILGAQHDFEGARAHYAEALTLFREQGSRKGLAAALNNLGDLEYYQGNLEEALRLQEQSLAISRELNHRDGVIVAQYNLGRTLTRLGDFRRSRNSLEECLRLSCQGENQLFIAVSLSALAALAEALGEWERAARYYGAGEAQYERLGCPLLPEQRAEFDTIYARLRARLTDARFSDAFASGRATPVEELIAPSSR